MKLIIIIEQTRQITYDVQGHGGTGGGDGGGEAAAVVALLPHLCPVHLQVSLVRRVTLQLQQQQQII